MTPDHIREAFERWFTRNDPTPEMAARAVRRNVRGDYILMQAHTAWEIWQAAYAQARAELIAEMRAKPVYWYDPDTPLAIVPEK